MKLLKPNLLFSDGKLDIVVPSFIHYLEVLEGSDGDKMPGNDCSPADHFEETFAMQVLLLGF